MTSRAPVRSAAEIVAVNTGGQSAAHVQYLGFVHRYIVAAPYAARVRSVAELASARWGVAPSICVPDRVATTTSSPRSDNRIASCEPIGPEESLVRLAYAQLDEGGIEALSLRAIARDLGIVSSAIYRYCASRDALITMLVIDAYRSVGAAAAEAGGPIARTDYCGRRRATIGAIRGWALRYPNRYALIYGTPVPGYRAPEDTIGPATLVGETVLAVAADLYAAGHKPKITHALKTAAPGFVDLARRTDAVIPPSHIAIVVEVWTRMFGIVSFELFGQYINVVGDAETYYDFVADDMARRLGAPAG